MPVRAFGKSLPVFWRLLVSLPLLLSLGWVVLSLEQQEAQVWLKAEQQLKEQQAVQEAWQRWLPHEPLAPLLERGLPWERSLCRLVLRQYAFQLELLPSAKLSAQLPGSPNRARLARRLDDEGFLVQHAYAGVPPATLLPLELALLGWSRVPVYRLRPALEPRLSDVMALQTDLAEALRLRCPRGCPPLTGGDALALELRLISLLDAGSYEQAVHALALLLERKAELVPLLSVRLEQARTRQTQTLAFLGLSQVLPGREGVKFLQAALEGPEPGLQLLAMLEAVRRGEGALWPFPAHAGLGLPVGAAAHRQLEQLFHARLGRKPAPMP